MAVATNRGRSQPRRTAERDVELVLARSPLNLANLLTIGRLLLVAPIIWLIATERLETAFWLFLAAGVSDALDGYIAKNFNARTNLGAYLDPLADKVMLNGIYFALALIGWLPAWLAGLVIARDLLIVSGVILIQRRQPVFRATPLKIGKANTFAQIVLIAATIASQSGWVDLAGSMPLLIAAVTATTLMSGGAYMVQAVRAVRPEPTI